MSFGAIAVQRGCGTRSEGGAYFEMGVGIGGLPIEAFLIDSPHVVPSALKISPRGVQMIEQQQPGPDGEIQSVWHLVDWVGAEHYPNVADFVEEARRFGVSRRLPRNLDFSKITPESRLLLVHARAYVVNTSEYSQWRCPKQFSDHAPEKLLPGQCCAGVWWRDITDHSGFDVERRDMPSFSYFGHRAPEGLEPEYSPAIFMSVPCSRIAVVSGEGSGETMETVKHAGVIVEEVDF